MCTRSCYRWAQSDTKRYSITPVPALPLHPRNRVLELPNHLASTIIGVYTMSDPQPLTTILGAPDTVQRFRILVIGSANAGKTTILNKVCNGKVCNYLRQSCLESSLRRVLKTDVEIPTEKVHSQNHFYDAELIVIDYTLASVESMTSRRASCIPRLTVLSSMTPVVSKQAVPTN